MPGALVEQGLDVAGWRRSTRGLIGSVRHSRKAADSKGRPVVPQFATLVLFHGLDLWTIWGVQLPACLPHA